MSYPWHVLNAQKDPYSQVPAFGDHGPVTVSSNQFVARTPDHYRRRTSPYKIARPNRNFPDTSEVQGQKPDSPRAPFLQDLPAHDYILPQGGPLNFTIAEIIVILPHWFRNGDLVVRFMNNGMSAGVHFLILDSHRQLNLPTEIQRERARGHISDAYRKTMRKIYPTWTKAKHVAPLGWNDRDLSVSHIVLDVMRKPGLSPVPSVVFKTLADELKKLPEGNDAGDLTRALTFAMNNQKDGGLGNQVDYLFPDDLHAILDRIGRTQLNLEQTDPYIIARYCNKLWEGRQERYEKQANMRKQQQGAEICRGVQIVIQQDQYQITQPPLPSDFQIQVDPQQAQNPFQTTKTEPSGSRIIQHGQHGRSQAFLQANLHTPTSMPTTPGISNGTGKPPVSMGVLVPEQNNIQEHRFPYGNPTRSDPEDIDLRMTAAITEWLAEHDRNAKEVAQQERINAITPFESLKIVSETQPGGQVEEDFEMMPEWQYNDIPEHEILAIVPQHGFFPPVPDVCRIQELDQAKEHRAAPHPTTHGNQLSTMEDMDAMLAPYQFPGKIGLLTPPKDNYPDDETRATSVIDLPEAGSTPAIDLAEPENDCWEPILENAPVLNNVTIAPSAERLVDRAEGDDLTDTSDLARAVRWARTLTVFGEDFVMGDLDIVIKAMNSSPEYIQILEV
ncbi:hypothetical protein T440DRAFT_398467 [Plenodomus tracheiphilus IPT5]|uniref:Uncharacterized protein n=1 Tax=Plenodomus tracheiphilus IPT5 TaxID=1408161 RepID=A0A6A7B383_9PLEO|nr:hypothetical protein T440DRAFT_398467 [Plenodomus tracheiphilus IPT5]